MNEKLAIYFGKLKSTFELTWRNVASVDIQAVHSGKFLSEYTHAPADPLQKYTTIILTPLNPTFIY